MKLKEDKHWKTSKAKLLGEKKVLVSLTNNNLPENSWGVGVGALHSDELRGRWAGWGDNELTASNCAGLVEPRARITETPPKSLHKCTNRWLLKKQGNNVEVFLWLKNLHKALKQSFGGDFFFNLCLISVLLHDCYLGLPRRSLILRFGFYPDMQSGNFSTFTSAS